MTEHSDFEDYNAPNGFCYNCERLKAYISLLKANVKEPSSDKRFQIVMADVTEEIKILKKRIDTERPELSEVQRLSVCMIFQISALRAILEDLNEKVNSIK